MTVNPVQLNIENTKINPVFKQHKEYSSYLNANETITTEDKVKPLPPQGHLVHDNIATGTKYFFKDIGYDMKSIKNGYKGTANDHQLGRLNDVGLRLGGIGIAAYLASRTPDPKARLMEYIGLGVFLAAMSIYPKLFINAPAKMLHGYDIDKQYIDDQGRKKSVQQDSNYVPYDMYQGGRKDEDLDAIGDRMGIPRDIKNRHDIIKEQMRKIATQNNTLWMLTAGFATPIMTALACCGIENYIVSPAVAKSRNNKANKQIENMFAKMEGLFKEGTKPAADNNLSKKIESIITSYRNQELPLEEFDNIAKILTDGLPESTADTVKLELKALLNPEQKEATNSMLQKAQSIFAHCRNKNAKTDLNITTEELDKIIENTLKEGGSADKFKKALRELLDKKIAASGVDGTNKGLYETLCNNIINELSKGFKTRKTSTISETTAKKLIDFSKILGEFKENRELLLKLENFKFEFAPETILARSSAKFERTFLKELGISNKDLKKMRDSAEYAKRILDEKLTLAAKDEAKFKKLMETLANVVSEMEGNLNGSASEPILKKLINSCEYLYNGTAKRLSSLGGFEETAKKLIGEDPSSAKLEINSIEDLFKFLDGLTEKVSATDSFSQVREYSRGVGSDKALILKRIFERYNGTMNGFDKVLHAIDTYRKIFTSEEFIQALSSKDPEYVKAVLEKCKETLLTANPSAHFNKLNTYNAHEFYKDVMKTLYGGVGKDGIVTDATENALKDLESAKTWKILERMKAYIAKFRNIIGNDTTDFQKAEHILDDMAKEYSRMAQTPGAKSDLIGQDLVEYIRKAAGRKYSTLKWAKIVGGILAGVAGITLLAQFSFGRIRNPHNIQKQVNNASDK